MPVDIPTKDVDSWYRLWATTVVCFAEIFQKLMLANFPMALTMLTVAEKVNAKTMILDGLAITFFMFIDDIASFLILNNKLPRSRVERYMRRLEIYADQDLSRRHRANYESWIVTITTFSICLFGVYGVRRVENCESVIYWLNYRITVQFGIWLVSALKEAPYLCRRVWNRCCNSRPDSDNEKGSAPWWQWWRVLAKEMIVWFLETLVVATTQNCLFYLATKLYYEIPLIESLQHYFWPEVKGVFGACAGIPWDSSFPCAWPWPFPGNGGDGL